MRSQWEEKIEEHIRREYPSLYIRTNDRSIIPSRDTGQNLEIDIYIPSLKLGFELNGEPYHNKQRYGQDKRNDTEYSEEMYKEKYCERHGIKLLHVWSENGDDYNLAAIDGAIKTAKENTMSSLSSQSKKNTDSKSSSSKKEYDFYEEQRKTDNLSMVLTGGIGAFMVIGSLYYLQESPFPIFGLIVGSLLLYTTWDTYKQSQKLNK